MKLSRCLDVHLTNVAIAKSASDYDPERGLKWSLDKLRRYLTARHGVEMVTGLLFIPMHLLFR